MKHPNVRIARLKEMIALEEKRATLQNHIAAVNERLSIIQNELYGANAVSANEQWLPAQTSLVKIHSKGLRKGRGELKGQILEMLNAAGKNGVSVKELADRIGVKSVNIHAWFSANMKKIAGLKKVGTARYALNGALVAAPKISKKGKEAKKAKSRKGPKSPKKAKDAKAMKAVKKGKSVKAGRGQLKSKILGALKSAGSEGVTIKDLAEKLNANYKNIYIWFVTTGKKISGIKKLGPARYKLES